MLRILFLLCCLIPTLLRAQIRAGKILVKKGETYHMKTSDIIVADTLILEDSSKLKLNPSKTENYIRVKVAIIGENAMIDGKGMHGLDGRDGNAGKSPPMGPCRDGFSAKNGTKGTNGGKGKNLFLYIDKIVVNGNLVIDLSGGNGGDGGEGGRGGGGSPGTVHCNGGNGGDGGDGGNGGDGGSGGILTFGGTDMAIIRGMIGSEIVVNVLGGNFGYSGVAGMGGPAGLGPSGMNGKPGKEGSEGENGEPGANGSIQYDQQ